MVNGTWQILLMQPVNIRNMKNRIILDAPWRSAEGNSLAQHGGYVAERLFVDEADVANSPVQSFDNQKAMAGDIKYKDINGDGQITETDMVPIVPDFS